MPPKDLMINSLAGVKLFAPIWPTISKFAHLQQLPSTQDLNETLRVDGISFVPQNFKSNNFFEGYEPRIYLKGEVQTRDQNWHDFFNAVIWHQFPLTKKTINRLQYELQTSRNPKKERLPAENMLTLFDENGAIVIARDPELLDLIRTHRWHELFWQRREQIRSDVTVIIFGHGIYEKALAPYIGLTAKALLIVKDESTSIDVVASEILSRKNVDLRTTDLNPLPILGLPGWWPDNDHEAFYSNEGYFRSSTGRVKIDR